MEMDLLIEVLKLVVPSIIALGSLYYAIKQRSLVKGEISKKRYLESALSNLNEAIKSLRSINIPRISSLGGGYDLSDAWADVSFCAYSVCSEIFRASFELKKKKIPVEVSYSIRDLGVRPKFETAAKTIENFDGLDLQWFIDFLQPNRAYMITSHPRISNFEQFTVNDIDFGGFERGIDNLKKALEALLPYEEVFETVSPNSVKKTTELFEELAEEIFKTFSRSKTIEINLEKFGEMNGIIRYLIEQTLNYSRIAEKFSKVSEVISELIEARKELFLKIS